MPPIEKTSADQLALGETPAAAASHPPGDAAAKPKVKAGWLIIQTNGQTWGRRFNTRGQACRQADRDRAFTTRNVFVKHTRTGEAWKRNRGSWFKTEEGKRG